MKKTLLLLCVLALTACKGGSSVTNPELVFFANNFELLAETPQDRQTISARVFKTREFGECDNGKCPKEQVYIAVSEFGEYPEQRLYVSAPADEWEFSGWQAAPATKSGSPVVVFDLQSKSGESEQRYSVTASLSGIEFVKAR